MWAVHCPFHSLSLSQNPKKRSWNSRVVRGYHQRDTWQQVSSHRGRSRKLRDGISIPNSKQREQRRRSGKQYSLKTHPRWNTSSSRNICKQHHRLGTSKCTTVIEHPRLWGTLCIKCFGTRYLKTMLTTRIVKRNFDFCKVKSSNGWGAISRLSLSDTFTRSCNLKTASFRKGKCESFAKTADHTPDSFFRSFPSHLPPSGSELCFYNILLKSSNY